MKYCANDVSFYSDMLREFVSSKPEKVKTLTECFEKEDWKNYKIYVHALKTNMRSIGADEISKLAKELEDASGSGDSESVTIKHSDLIREYDKLSEEISSIELLG